MIPARARGRVDLIINGSFWLGAVAGGLLSLVLLQESLFALDVGWRLAFGLGALLGLGILLVRRHLPESPRWLFIHGREEEAERLVDGIEREVSEDTGPGARGAQGTRSRSASGASIPFREIARTAFKVYPKRAVLGFSLFIGQAFLYNAVTVTLGLTLTTYLGVGANKVGLFYAVFAAGNFLGPLLLGRLFDTVGRRPMIAGTYLISAVLLAVIGIAFNGEVFSDWGLTLALAATFFFASAGASSAYLTVSEIFPMEIRALAIAFFYAIGTAIGGITGPLVFEKLGESGDVSQVMIAYLIGAAVMAVGGIAELFLGVRAEQKPLENIAKPITAREAEEEAGPATRAMPSAPRPRSATAATASAGSASGMGLRRFRPGPGTRLVLAVPAAALRAQPRLARPRGLDHRPGAAGAGRARPAPARGAGRGALLGPGPLPRGAARGGERRRRPPRRPRPLRLDAGDGRHPGGLRRWRSGAPSSATASGSGRRARPCAGPASAGAGSRARRPTQAPAEAARYAAAFDRDDARDLGRRAPLSLFPLRLTRRRS